MQLSACYIQYCPPLAFLCTVDNRFREHWLPWTIRRATASVDPMTFVALQMYFPWLSPEAGEITKTPSLLLFSGLFSSVSQTTAGGGLPALTTQRKTTVSPPVTVSFFAGMISIFGITWPKRVVINVLTLFLARNLVATLVLQIAL